MYNYVYNFNHFLRDLKFPGLSFRGLKFRGLSFRGLRSEVWSFEVWVFETPVTENASALTFKSCIFSNSWIIDESCIFSNILEGTTFLLQCVTENASTLTLNVTSLKYGKYDRKIEKINNNKRLSDRDK